MEAKLADRPIEAIRTLGFARNDAIKARTATLYTLRALVVTTPEPPRFLAAHPLEHRAHEHLRSGSGPPDAPPI